VTATWRAIAAAAPPRLIDLVSRRYEGRRVDLAADTYYASAALAGLPAHVTVCVSLRRDTALYASAPPRTGRPGRPCKKGHLLPSLALAGRGLREEHPRALRQDHHGRDAPDRLPLILGLPRPVRQGRVLCREPGSGGFEVAFRTTDTQAAPRR
jgi:hypothetical protein